MDHTPSQLSLATRGEDWASQGQPKGKATPIPKFSQDSYWSQEGTCQPVPLAEELATHNTSTQAGTSSG